MNTWWDSTPTPTATRAAAQAVLGGIQPQPLPNQADGALLLADLAAALKPDDPHCARTRLLCLENTWNGPGAAAALHRAGDRLGARPGAGHPPGRCPALQRRGGQRRCRSTASPGHFDSVSLCFSKGLGRAGRFDAVRLARADARGACARARMLGGGLRQAGLLAAAADHALDHHIERLAEDHLLARRLADGLAALGLKVRAPQDQYRVRGTTRHPG
jgi:threonine aldolase